MIVLELLILMVYDMVRGMILWCVLILVVMLGELNLVFYGDDVVLLRFLFSELLLMSL